MATIPTGYYDILGQLESGGNNNASPGTSSASGIFQFTNSTWQGLGYSLSDKLNLPTEYSAAQTFTQANANILSNNGIDTSIQNLYIAHFLGAGSAVNVLGAPDNTPIASLVSQKAIMANRSLLGGGQTVGGFKTAIANRIGKAAKAVGQTLSNPLQSDGLGLGRAALTSVFGDKVGNTLADVNQKAGQAMIAATDPFVSLGGGITDGLGITGSCSWLCQLEQWISKSGFFQRLALAVFALIMIAVGLSMLKSVQGTVVNVAKAAAT